MVDSDSDAVPCTGAKSQRWTIINSNSNGPNTFTFKNVATGSCLSNSDWGEAVSLYRCADTDNQKWLIEGGKLKSVINSGKCLEASARFEFSTFITVRSESCNDYKQGQQWRLNNVSNTFIIRK